MSAPEREYYCWVNDSESDSFAELGELPAELEEHYWKLTDGVASKDWFPEGVVFDLDPNEGIKLADSIPNTSHLKVISERMKDLLEQYSSEFEFFPVAIRNAKGKLVKKSYFLANLLKSIPGIDMQQSKVRTSALDPSQVNNIDKLVLNAAATKSGSSIFRLTEYPYLYVVTKELALDIRKAHGCDGLRFIPVKNYNSIDYF
ncbi:imm11 family protein [Hahella ganghwensis]|uniref:imm11 family protein n=1 Tax=Hahella ganghwensis TaxID=286420 RepID=UPI00037E56A0|nr:DUF1629 domain-containing protein [Hahella ganghwensis]